MQAAAELICVQFQDLQANQLKLWNYEQIQEELARYKDLDKKYNKLQRDLKLYQDGYLKHQSLIQLRTKLKQVRKENGELRSENEALVWQLKGTQEKLDSIAVGALLRDQFEAARV